MNLTDPFRDWIETNPDKTKSYLRYLSYTVQAIVMGLALGVELLDGTFHFSFILGALFMSALAWMIITHDELN